MSNTLAIAAVTATLARVLRDELTRPGINAISGVQTKLVRPTTREQIGFEKGVSIYLYQVMPNAAGRNLDLPTRDSDRKIVKRPTTALDLMYLLSFYGDEATAEPQRILGRVAAYLHANPVLSPKEIEATRNEFEFVKDSDLDKQVELVRFTPISFNLEELSKIWSVFFQTPHVLAVGYQASVVFVETEDVPSVAAPVQDRGFFTDTGKPPRLSGVRPQILTRAEKLTLFGKGLAGDDTSVRFGALAPVAPDTVASDRIEVSIPAGLKPGVNTVAVLHRKTVESTTGETLTVPFESNIAAFILAPLITDVASEVARGSPLTITVDPEVGPARRVALIFGGLVLEGPVLDAATSTLVFDIPSDAPLGDTPIRLDVDGAVSPLVEEPAPPGQKPVQKPFVKVTP
jgi:hypothetical protein